MGNGDSKKVIANDRRAYRLIRIATDAKDSFLLHMVATSSVKVRR